MRILIVAYRSFHGNRFLRDLENLAYFIFRHFHAHRQLFRRRLAAHFLKHLTGDAIQFVDRLDHVHRNTDRACLIGDRSRYGLSNPPSRVGREFVAAAVLEFIYRLHQSDIAFLNQVEELQAAIGVLFGDGNHEAQIRLDHLFLRTTCLRLADGHFAIDFLDLANQNVEQTLEILQLVLTTFNFVLELGERCGIAFLRFDVLFEPTGTGLVLRESRNEILAWHPGLLDAQEHDFLLEQANLGHVLAEIVDQLIEHFRAQLQFHQFAADLLANFLRFRILGPELVERTQELMMKLRNRTESLGCLFGIRAGVDNLFILVTIGLVLVVGGLFALESHHLRILRLSDFIRRVRVDEADNDVHQTHLACLHRFIVPQQ